MNSATRVVLSLVMTLTGLTATVAVAPSAFAACVVAEVHYTTPNKGRKVWIPTSTFSDWKKGGKIVRTESDGESTAKTTGSVHEVSVKGKVGAKYGPIGAEVTTEYNTTWSQSTRRTTSVTRGWQYHFYVPDDALYRARAYKLGWVYKYQRIVTYINPCDNLVEWRYGVAPVAQNKGTYYWALEKFTKKGDLRYDNL
ncbi:MAG TPA: hypothetical protein VLI04_15625 [Nocardioidaceae bacterium]|nr:hypothetical protein [Nocardioidaceae bacterium]